MASLSLKPVETVSDSSSDEAPLVKAEVPVEAQAKRKPALKRPASVLDETLAAAGHADGHGDQDDCSAEPAEPDADLDSAPKAATAKPATKLKAKSVGKAKPKAVNAKAKAAASAAKGKAKTKKAESESAPSSLDAVPGSAAPKAAAPKANSKAAAKSTPKSAPLRRPAASLPGGRPPAKEPTEESAPDTQGVVSEVFYYRTSNSWACKRGKKQIFSVGSVRLPSEKLKEIADTGRSAIMTGHSDAYAKQLVAEMRDALLATLQDDDGGSAQPEAEGQAGQAEGGASADADQAGDDDDHVERGTGFEDGRGEEENGGEEGEEELHRERDGEVEPADVD